MALKKHLFPVICQLYVVFLFKLKHSRCFKMSKQYLCWSFIHNSCITPRESLGFFHANSLSLFLGHLTARGHRYCVRVVAASGSNVCRKTAFLFFFGFFFAASIYLIPFFKCSVLFLTKAFWNPWYVKNNWFHLRSLLSWVSPKI